MLLSQVSELKNELTKRASTPKALFEELGTNVSTKLSELKATVTNIKDGAPGSDKGLWRLDSDGMPLPEDGSPAADPDSDSDVQTPVGLSQGTLLYRLRHLEAKVSGQEAELAECRAELDERDRRIAQLQARCGTLSAKLEERDSQTAALEARLARLSRRVRESEVYGPPPWAAAAAADAAAVAAGGIRDDAGAREREERVRAARVDWTGEGAGLGEDLVPGYDELCALLREPVAAPLLGMIDSFVKALVLKTARGSDYGMVHNFLGAMENPFRAHKLWRDATDDEMLLTLDALEAYVLRDPRVVESVLATMGPALAERDAQLSRRMWCLQFVRARHLDVRGECTAHPASILARKMLVRMTQVPSPQEKLECVFRAARIVYRMLNELCAVHGRHTASADDFLPVWILVVLAAQPPRLLSTLEYIATFRSPHRLQGERHYYLVQLQTAAAFLEHLDAASLSIDPAEFERLLAEREAAWAAREAAVSAAGSAPRADENPADADAGGSAAGGISAGGSAGLGGGDGGGGGGGLSDMETLAL